MKDIRYVIQIEFAFKPRRAKEKGEAREPESIFYSSFWVTSYNEGRLRGSKIDGHGRIDGVRVGARHPRARSRDLPFSGYDPPRACVLHRTPESGTLRFVIYATDRDRDRDLVVRSVHYHHYHYHHRCRNGSRAMASAITWPRCAFAWKSESLNKLPASVRAIWRDQKARRPPERMEIPSCEGLASLTMSARTILRLDGGSPTRRVLRTLAERLDRSWLWWRCLIRDLGPRSRRLWTITITITSPLVCSSSSHYAPALLCSGWAGRCYSFWPPSGKSHC